MKKILLIVVLVGVGFVLMRCGSGSSEAPKPVETRTGSPASPPAIAQQDATAGKSFNSLFPSSNGDGKLVFTQEKAGFASADWSRGGSKVAVLSISDTDANPSARDKFKGSTKQIGGFPAAAVGSQGTAVLVADRYQVQVRSAGPSFSAADREQLLAAFKLKDLEKLKPGGGK
jgi:hypothetical protein